MSVATTPRTGTRPRPERAIDSRRREATTKVAFVEKAVRLLGRTGALITRAAVSQPAGRTSPGSVSAWVTELFPDGPGRPKP